VVRAEPQSKEVALLERVVGVFVRLAGVKNRGVVEELDIAGSEAHLDVNRGIIRDRLDQLHRLDLRGSQPRHLRMPLRIPDVPTDVEHPGRPVHVVEDG